jgi:N-acetylmuramoyl-L-alanine amidase
MEREKSGKYNRLVRIGLLLMLLAAFGFALRGGARMVSSNRALTEKTEKVKPCVVIDAGHGGADPGKVGVDGSLEKDINLKIAKKLAMFLTAADVDVVLTREDDAGLYDENVSNKKVQDMKNRVALIEEKKPALTVSIHQNSYHEEYVHGAQVFYYEGSEESKEIAERMQRVLAEQIDPDNARKAKANGSYYLLKKTSSPIVIVECGFLSNYEEAQKLSSEVYQEKTAWAIHLAIMNYLNKTE